VLERFLAYPWPGNVRELLNAIEHAATLGEETIELGDLPARVRGWTAGDESPASTDVANDAALTLAEVERRHVLKAVAREGGDRRRAAEALGIDLSTLYRKLKRWEDE
jgi:two-component system response regulator HydG